MAGFGDLAGLKKPRFSPIDIPIMGRVHFARRSSVLLLSYLGVELAPMVAVRHYRRRKSDPSYFPFKTSATIYRSTTTTAFRCPGHRGVADSRRVLYN
jgi:hypothetical protein